MLKVKQKVVASLIEHIVVNLAGQIVQNLLASGLYRTQNLLVLARQIEHAKLLLVHIDNERSDPITGLPLLF